MDWKSRKISGLPRVIAAILCATAISGAAHAITPDVLFEQISPSIWTVIAYNADKRPIAQGSAVVIGPGKLITNCHVLARSSAIQVAKDNVSYLATLEFPDPERDLCQLNVRNFSAAVVRRGSTTSLKVGQRVYAIGNPQGLELSRAKELFHRYGPHPDRPPSSRRRPPCLRAPVAAACLTAMAC